MSGFLSDKYLRYRGAAMRGTVVQDTPCPQCGYNLRGLPQGRACPECGGDGWAHAPGIAGKRRSPLIDAMLHGEESNRDRWKLGLTLAIGVIAAMLLARLVMFGISFVGFAPEIQVAYFTLAAVLSVVWTIGVFMIMPPTLIEHWPWMRHWRTAVLITQPLWIVGTACVLVKITGGPGGGQPWEGMQLASRGVAGVGFIILGFLLTHVAQEAELEPGWQRLNTATWLVGIPTLMAAAFPPSIPWIALVILAFILIWWTWMLGLFMLGLVQMRQHVAWGIRHRVDGTARMQRIAEKRAQIDARVHAKIRPVSGVIVTKPTSDTLPRPAQHAPLTSSTSQPDQAPIALADADDTPATPRAEATARPTENASTKMQPPFPDRTPPRAPGTSLWDV